MKKNSKIISVILVLTMLICLNGNVFAVDKLSAIPDNSITFDISQMDEEDVLTMNAYITKSGEVIITQNDVQPYITVEHLFSLKLRKLATGKFYMWYQASANDNMKYLTGYKATIYTKNTNVIGTELNESFLIQKSGLVGTYTYSAMTSTFSIPSDIEKVTVGWSNLRLYGSLDDISIKNASAIVDPSKL